MCEKSYSFICTGIQGLLMSLVELVSSPHHSNRMQPVSNYLVRKCRNVSRPREYCLVAEWQPEGVGTDNCPMAPHIQVPLMFRQDHDNDNFRRYAALS
jgi:hypothetical protein